MNLLTMEHLTKFYTERMLFQDAGFSINEGEKIQVDTRTGEYLERCKA